MYWILLLFQSYIKDCEWCGDVVPPGVEAALREAGDQSAHPGGGSNQYKAPHSQVVCLSFSLSFCLNLYLYFLCLSVSISISIYLFSVSISISAYISFLPLPLCLSLLNAIPGRSCRGWRWTGPSWRPGSWNWKGRRAFSLRPGSLLISSNLFIF